MRTDFSGSRLALLIGFGGLLLIGPRWDRRAAGAPGSSSSEEQIRSRYLSQITS
jgi:hypothetical protein